VFFNAEDAEIAENCKERGTLLRPFDRLRATEGRRANNMLCEPLTEIALPLLLNPPSAASATSALR
jgi:hypothetical protein